MKLYEISIEAAAIEQLLTDAEGELTPELEQHITEFLRGGKEKLEHAACVLQSLAVQAEACRAESVRLDNRRRALERNSERLKSLMLIALDAAFGGKIKTAMFTIWGQTSAGSATFALAKAKSCTTFLIGTSNSRLHIWTWGHSGRLGDTSKSFPRKW